MLIGFSALGFVFFEVSHGHLIMFFSMESVLMVGFSSISVTFMAMPMDKMKQVASYIKKTSSIRASSQSRSSSS